MKITLKDIIRVIPRYSKNIFTISFYGFLSLFYAKKEKFRNAWLICERGIEAKDNGFAFFRYVRINHPEKKVYYLIDSKQKEDFQRVKEWGNLIEYGSFEHKMALFFASHFISTHIGYMMPWSYLLFKKILATRSKYVFLQHGVTKEDLSNIFNKSFSGVDLFITSTKKEWESIVYNKNYGFNEYEVVLTGFARFDHLLPFSTKRQILFMPTWRQYLVNRPIDNKNQSALKNTFIHSSYFRHLFDFLKNEKLATLLDANNLELIFYPHFEMQKSLSLFAIDNKRIIIAKKETHDVQQLLKESLMLITDYSSVAFDFAYMKKPLIYYQFDQEEYYGRHYKKGYFDYDRDGFGAVVETEDQLINEIEHIIANDFSMEKSYMNRVDETFLYHDNRNCERIYAAINNTPR